MRIVVTGLLGQYPFGGVVWDYIQYLLGFRALGHEVYYLEDSGSWPYDPVAKTISADCSYNVSFLGRMMEEFGLGDRWIYRNAADGQFYGAGERLARDLLRGADLLLNVSTASWLSDYEIGVGHQMFIDGDPMFTQIRLARGEEDDYTRRLRGHDSHFTFGLNVGAPDCLAPACGIEWKKTVQPVALEWWPEQAANPEGAWTTVMNWASYQAEEWAGKAWGQKDVEFEKFMDLPGRTRERFVMAVGKGVGNRRPTERLQEAGWGLVEPDEVIPDHHRYREFLMGSKGEWSVAKHAYVAGRTGWFSCRTACYLALGRPAVVQDTGWTKHLPSGRGVIGFETMEEALAGLESVVADVTGHGRAAREFAESYLDARVVCRDLLRQAGLA
ncbi:MAG: glycosyltransferase family 1 protein [Verrucomicrobiia bacterium]